MAVEVCSGKAWTGKARRLWSVGVWSVAVSRGGRVELRLGRLGSGTARRSWPVMFRFGTAGFGEAV